MVPSLRNTFNETFTQEKYDGFLRELNTYYPDAIQFRLAETPVFVPRRLAQEMIDTCESIIDFVLGEQFMKLTERSIPATDKVSGEPGLPTMIAFDFGICTGPGDELVPRLVEMQGFPSLYGFQSVFPDILRKHFPIPDNYAQYLSGYTTETYQVLLREVILGGHHPENVILLEIEPERQKTRIDFYCTRDIAGIQPVCLTSLVQDGDHLYYELNGQKIRVHRIYNRMIFDELHSRKELQIPVDIRNLPEVEWVSHPDWFYRISKFTLPFLKHPNIPDTYFLDEVKQVPADLNDYVLKPLFSFAGQGVVINVSPDHLERIEQPANWILQKKVQYAPAIRTPDGPAKTEIRIMYLWKKGRPRPEPVINLARLSKGDMIGTRYTDNDTWVGGSVAFFER